MTNFVQAWGGTTDADRAELGITVRDTARTRVGGSRRARWVNTRGEKGPWSEVTTDTVAA